MDVYVYMDALLAECRGEVRVPELGQKLTEFSVRVVSTLKHSHFQPCLCRDFSVVAPLSSGLWKSHSVCM